MCHGPIMKQGEANPAVVDSGDGWRVGKSSGKALY